MPLAETATTPALFELAPTATDFSERRRAESPEGDEIAWEIAWATPSTPPNEGVQEVSPIKQAVAALSSPVSPLISAGSPDLGVCESSVRAELSPVPPSLTPRRLEDDMLSRAAELLSRTEGLQHNIRSSHQSGSSPAPAAPVLPTPSMSVDTDLISRAHLSLQSLSDEAERLEYKMHMQQRRISERAEYERATSERRATLTPSGAAREVREEMEVLNRSLHEQLSSIAPDGSLPRSPNLYHPNSLGEMGSSNGEGNGESSGGGFRGGAMFSVGALRASGFLSGSRSSHSDAHTVTARAAPVGSTPSRAQPQRETIAPLQMAWGSIDTGRGRHEVAAVQQREVASGRLRELTVHGLELTEAERTEAERSAVQRAEAERSALARAERTPRSLPSSVSAWPWGVWQLLVACTVVPAWLHLLPLPYLAGAAVKATIALHAGPLVALHLSALTGYALLLAAALVPAWRLWRPAALSVLACIALLLPHAVGAPAALRLPLQLERAFGAAPSHVDAARRAPPLFDARTWLQPPHRCLHAADIVTRYASRTVVYRTHRPARKANPTGQHAATVPGGLALAEGPRTLHSLGERAHRALLGNTSTAASDRVPGELRLTYFYPPAHSRASHRRLSLAPSTANPPVWPQLGVGTDVVGGLPTSGVGRAVAGHGMCAAPDPLASSAAAGACVPLDSTHARYHRRSVSPHRAPPLLVFLHGGGWWTGERLGSSFACHLRQAHSLGYAVATVEYRLLADGWEGQHMLDDVLTAIRYLRSRSGPWGFSSRHLVLLGASGGGHLALAAAYTLNAQLKRRVVRAVAALSAATDLSRSMVHEPIGHGAWDEAEVVRRLCGAGAEGGTAGRETWWQCDARLSPTRLIGAHAPPTLLYHPSHDEYHALGHAHALGRALQAAGVPHVVLALPLMASMSEGGERSWPAQVVRYALHHLLATVATQA